MKKVLIYFVLMCLTTAVQAQDKLSSYYVELGSGIGTGSLNDSEMILSTRDISVSFGYDLSRKFTLKLPLTLSAGMFDTEDIRLYDMAGMIGLGAGYNFVIKPDYRWQLAAEAGNTLNGKKDEWKFFYYDVSCRFYMGAADSRINGFAGLGLRQLFPDTKNAANQIMPYVSFGIKLNHFKRK